MISCSNCNTTFSFISRLKSINRSVIKCDKCENIYKMKYVKLFSFINVFLIMVFSPRLSSLFPDVNFLISVLISMIIAIIWSAFLFAFYFYIKSNYFDFNSYVIKKHITSNSQTNKNKYK